MIVLSSVSLLLPQSIPMWSTVCIWLASSILLLSVDTLSHYYQFRNQYLLSSKYISRIYTPVLAYGLSSPLCLVDVVAVTNILTERSRESMDDSFELHYVPGTPAQKLVPNVSLTLEWSKGHCTVHIRAPVTPPTKKYAAVSALNTYQKK